MEKDYASELIWASASGKISAAKEALAQGVDVNHKNPVGATALHFSSNRHNPEIVNLLLDHGARIDEQDSFGETPLHWTSTSGAEETATVLLARGADPFIKNKNGRTARQDAELCNFFGLAALIQKEEEKRQKQSGFERNIHALDKLHIRRPPQP